MRKIYTITFEDDNPLSKINLSKLKGIVWLLFSEISKFDNILICSNDDNKDRLIINELNEKNVSGNYIYRFISEKEQNKDNNYMYEPFVISDNSFGFTVYNDSIDETEISILLDNILKIVGCNYKYTINHVCYDSKIHDARYNAINSLINKDNGVNRVKTKIKIPILGIIK